MAGVAVAALAAWGLTARLLAGSHGTWSFWNRATTRQNWLTIEHTTSKDVFDCVIASDNDG